MALAAGLRHALETRFGCPVLDLYSMNEAGPVAVYDPRCGGHVLLQPGLYVELLDAHGRPVPAGARGEITLTGGFNHCLPLLRYRTGDHASLQHVGHEPVLVQLEGRPPVSFRTTRHAFINNIDVTHALARFDLAQHTVHQRRSGELQLRCADRRVDEPGILAALRGLFGADQAITIETGCVFEGKVVQYTSELSPP
jgi:phenylacetate-CoA ligase